jgi:Concanavalin A-like lectin/glucanases superfamily/Metallo-peptidase family M12/Bacterial Ig domain
VRIPSLILPFLCLPALAQAPFRVDLPAGFPESFEALVQREGSPELLRLTRHSVRAEDFRLYVYRPDGTTEEVPAPPPSTYRGMLGGDPGSVVLASLGPRGLNAYVVPSVGAPWIVEPLRGQARGIHRSGGIEPLDFNCGELQAPGSAAPAPPSVPTTPSQPNPPNCMYEAELAFDADYEYFLRQGGTVVGTLANIEGHTALLNGFYARDVQIQHRITAVIVRTAPFYFNNDGGHLLDLFRAEWNLNQTGIPRDMTHLMTDKSNLSGYAGLAYVGVVCNVVWAYGWSVDSTGVLGHELGHNWGAGHCHDTDTCNNMCGACLFVGPNTRDIIIAFRDSRPCLDLVGPYEELLAPYAYPDGMATNKEQLVAADQVLDVLANDDDGNCDPIGVVDFDAVTPAGATISLSPAQELVYSASQPHVGIDAFTYTVGDATGMSTVGAVTVDVPARELEASWALDEGSGLVAGDGTGYMHAGTLEGGPVWTPGGPYQGGLIFDGIDDQVRLPGLGLRGDEVTLCAWVRRDGAQAAWSGLLMSRAAGTDGGLHLGTANELRYTWSGDGNTSNWNSGLVLPDGQWVFVALVVRPDKVVMHMHDGVIHQKKTKLYSHGAQTFGGELLLAVDPADGARRFAGGLAGVRVYDRAMGANEVVALATQGGGSEAPGPRDGGQRAGGELSWLPGPQALGFDVYFGGDYVAVRDATQLDPEFQGSQASAGFDPGVLAGGPWFWRVDEQGVAGLIEGAVWQFSSPAGHRWALDELNGDVAADTLGLLDGTYKNTPLLGEPGATAQTGTSVAFDGNGEWVRLPALDLNDNRMTISGWVKRDGNQNPFTGLVFSRALNTIAGLHVGNANELRYTWNGTSNTYGWNSGLVLPDQQWVFVALVVEPTQATIYMGDLGGQLSWAVRPQVNGHGPEQFDGVTLIGRDASGGRDFKGWIDDVRVYRAALGTGQIQALYQGSL